jgi:hypothetical protein
VLICNWERVFHLHKREERLTNERLFVCWLKQMRARFVLSNTNSPRDSYLHSDNDPWKLDVMNQPTNRDDASYARRVTYEPGTLRIHAVDFGIEHEHAFLDAHAKLFQEESSDIKCFSLSIGFPRERAASTSVSGSSMVIKRTLFHEFVNGYNP